MNRRYMVWVDANGYTRLTLVNGTGAAGPPDLTTVQTVLLAQSNASVLNAVESALTVFVPVPLGGVFRTVGDIATLTFTDGGGELVNITLPAPLDSIFMADGVTVDPTAIAAIISTVVGTVVTAAGGIVTAYVAGLRMPKKGETY